MAKTSVLIVEDEFIVAKDIERMLEALGYNVVGIISSGKEAIKKAKITKPDVILMDIILDGKIDGIQAAAEIQKEYDIPVIYLTAYADKQTVQKAKKTKPYGYLVKPFEERELNSAIEIALYRFGLEQKLKENEERLNTILQSINEALIVTDKNGEISFMNKVAKRLLKCEEGETGQPCARILKIIDSDTNEIVNPIANVDTGSIYKLPLNSQLITPQGEKIPIIGGSAPLSDPSGRITGAVVTFSDITETKHLRELQEMLYNIADAANKTNDVQELLAFIRKELSRFIDTRNFYVGLYDRKHNVITLPYEADEQDKIPIVPVEGSLTGYVIRTGKPILVNQPRILEMAKKGEIKIIGELSKVWLGVPLKVADEIIGAVAVQSYTDENAYTEEDTEILEFVSSQMALTVYRKQQEDELRKNEAQLRYLFDNANDIIWTSDKEAKFLTANKLFETLLGYSKEELLEKNFSEIIKPAYQQKVVDAYKNAASGENSECEVILLTKQGEEQIFWLKLNPLKEEGKIVGVHGIGRDITEWRQAEQNLRATEEKLLQAQKMESIGRMAGGIAHDFNNMLTVINGRCSKLLQKMTPNDPFRKDVQDILNAGLHAANITNQLLTFSRKKEGHPTIVDVNKVIENMREMLQHLLGENIEMKTYLHAKPATVKIDSTQLEQVIMNLGVNARDAMPGGGKLTITTNTIAFNDNDKNHYIDLKPGKYVQIVVSDTGIGIDKNTLSHIFEPFFTTKDMTQGSGLGLSTAYGIIKQSNGFINAYSEIGKGTTFKVYLPLSQEKLVEKQKFAEPQEPTKPRHVANETILLVEDEEIVRNLVYEILSEQGYIVLIAQTGNEATSICKRYKGEIDLMVTDIIIPDMNGYELYKKARIIHPKMRVLYMSGYTGEDIMTEEELKKITPFLQKPFSPKKLLLKVQEILG